MEENLEGQEEYIKIKIFSSNPSFKQYRDPNYFNYQTRFNGFLSRNNISRKKDRAYVINQDHEKNKSTHWVSLFIDGNLPVYFDSFWN